MGIKQTSWDGVSRFNIAAAGFVLGAAVTQFMRDGNVMWLGICVLAAATCWHVANMKPPGE